MFKREIQVRFGECDGLGHVNNGTYFTYMEDARVDIFRLFNPALDLTRWNLIVASTKCEFLEQVRFAERLTVFTWVSRIGNSSFVVEHALQNAESTWVARGQAVLIAYDYNTHQSAPLWAEVRAELEEHAQAPDGVPVLRS